MKIKYILSVLLITSFLFSCNEEEWLKEEVYDFYVPETSYTNQDQFNAAVARLYSSTNDYIMWWGGYYDGGNYVYHYASDMAFATQWLHVGLSSYRDYLIPESAFAINYWSRYYRVIYDANVILHYIESDNVEFESEEARNSIKAEAMFFRAFMYRNLGIQFGGVPLILEPFFAPRRDLVRASRNEVYQQVISDLEFAATHLPHVTQLQQDGRLTQAAANHLLAELYIIVGDYEKAVTAASSVIDDPNYELMTNRFGTLRDRPGDVYNDLFVRDNQNRYSRGGLNTESIWVAQYEYNLEGGGLGMNSAFTITPQYWSLVGKSDGVPLFIGPTEKYGGYGVGIIAPTQYFFNLWTDNGDIRNSEYNIIYDIVADNPASAYYGQKIVENDAYDIPNWDESGKRTWSAIIAKMTPINNFPRETIENPSLGIVNTLATNSFTDHYYMRLAETYLLRAEAYLGLGNQELAAADINVVRARANATPVEPGNVDIDYILDERCRELHFEELRMLTLMRLGKLAERVRKYDPKHNGELYTFQVEEYHNVFPIPQSEIERNTEAVLEQNPGYR
jgi:starch-binding outer membrane protein, SusD/RagB family